MESRIARSILEKEEQVSTVLRGLSHPVRLRVLCFLMDQEKCVNELTVFCGISQSAMSQFLARMMSEGLVAKRREGQRMYYRVADRKLLALLRSLKGIYCG